MATAENPEARRRADAAIEATLRGAGIQPTAQRIAICRYVLDTTDHPTADEVKDWVDQRFPKMSLATVYNTLKTLVDAGLLRELKFPHLESAIYDPKVEEHYHFLDEASGELYDLDPSEVSISPQLKGAFQVKGIDLLLRGTREG